MSMARMIVALSVVNLVGFVAGSTRARPTGLEGTSNVLRGRSLELVDERRQVRARFNVEANGEVVLRLLDQQGSGSSSRSVGGGMASTTPRHQAASAIGLGDREST
jgi:hypothetical protein